MVIVALVVVLAGCGGLIAGDGDNGSVDLPDSDANETDTDRSDPDPEPQLEIAELSADQALSYNESLSGSVVVENTGGESGEGNLSVLLREDRLVSEEIELDPGERTEVSFETERLRYSENDYIVQGIIKDDVAEHEFALDHPSPYGNTTIDLYVNDSRVERNVSGLVDQSTRFWEEDDEEYFDYPVKYNIVEDEHAADKTLEFTNVDFCGLEPPVNSSYLGCADVPNADVSGEIAAEVQYNLSNPMMEETIRHELGHTLGLDHEDAPQYVMETNTSTRISPNQTKVYFRSTHGSVTATDKREAETAMDHFADDRDDLDREYGFDWTEVNSPADAHIVVTFDDVDGTCEYDTGGSCIGSAEYDTQLEIVLDDLDSEVVAWHVGAMLYPELYDERLDEFSGDVERSERETWPN